MRPAAPGGGTITTIAGSGVRGFSGDGGPAVSARMNYPRGVAVDGKGNVYITDEEHKRVRRVSPGGSPDDRRYGQNGLFRGQRPRDLGSAVLPGRRGGQRQGNLYVTDKYNQRVRKVSTRKAP